MDTDTSSSYTGHKSGYAAAQSRALDAIRNALKHRRINFHIATKLRDLIRSGRVDEAEGILRRYRQGPDR